jgi:hypothetical protein
VPQYFERFGVFRREYGEGNLAVGKLAVEIDDGAVYFGGDGVLGEAFADGLGHVARAGTDGDFTARAVGEF